MKRKILGSLARNHNDNVLISSLSKLPLIDSCCGVIFDLFCPFFSLFPDFKCSQMWVSVFQFTFQSYNVDDDDYEGYNYSLQCRLSAVRIVFLYRFVQEVSSSH